MEIKNCPVCNQPMNYNTDGLKRNPKAPIWKCADSNCKFSFDKNTKQWVAGKFVTGVWEEAKPTQKFEAGLNKDIQDEKWAKISEGKVRHGFSLEAYKFGKPLNPETTAEINKWVKFVMENTIDY